MIYKTEKGYIRYDYDDIEDAVVIEDLEAYEKRKGVGSELVRMAIDYAVEIGKNVSICARPLDDSISLEDLITFYENLGFDQEETGDEFFQNMIYVNYGGGQ